MTPPGQQPPAASPADRLRRAAILIEAFAENAATERFLIENQAWDDLAAMLKTQEALCDHIVSLLGHPGPNEAAELHHLRLRLAQIATTREESLQALRRQSAALHTELAQLRHTTKVIADWKRAWLPQDAPATQRLPSSYA